MVAPCGYQFEPDVCAVPDFSRYLRPLVRKNNTVLVLCRPRSRFISISVFFVVVWIRLNHDQLFSSHSRLTWKCRECKKLQWFSIFGYTSLHKLAIHCEKSPIVVQWRNFFSLGCDNFWWLLADIKLQSVYINVQTHDLRRLGKIDEPNKVWGWRESIFHCWRIARAASRVVYIFVALLLTE